MHAPSSSLYVCAHQASGALQIFAPPDKRRDLPSLTFFRFIFRRFVRGRGGTSRDEPYGLADRWIDPDLGPYKPTGSHEASALDPKTNTSRMGQEHFGVGAAGSIRLVAGDAENPRKL
jgi:hypothetical protein